MKKYILIISISIVFLFTLYSYASGYRLKVFPSNLYQGDVFIVKITSNKTLSLPSAVFNNNILYFNECGDKCYIALGVIDIETKPKKYPLIVEMESKKKKIWLIVKKKEFLELLLTLPKDKVFISPEDLKIIQNENEKLNSLFIRTTKKLWKGNFILPVDNEVSTLFGVKRIMNREHVSIHKGVDIRGKEGDNVKASNNGFIVFTGTLFFGGNTIILNHGMGIYTIYMHLSKLNVKEGDLVVRGDIIGSVGSTGRATGPHLHFGIKIANININPLSLLNLNLSDI